MTRCAHHKAKGFAAETDVMDLWDQGLCEADIAHRLGKSLSVIRRILQYMGAHEDAHAPIIAQRAGSDRLAAAILRERGAA